MQAPIALARPRVRPWLAAGALLALGLVCYGPALNGGLVWDDQAHVTRVDLRPLSGLGRIWFHLGATQQYYPVLHSAFWLEHRLWGDTPLGYHLLNVGLHVLAACLAATLLKRLAVPGAWLGRHRSRGPLAAWLFFGGSLFPALGFFDVYPFRYSYVADHFQYLASLGVFALAAAGAASWIGRLGAAARRAGWTGCILVVGLLSLLTLRQSGTYRSLWTLYAATIERNPGSWIAYNNLGVELSKIPTRQAEALADFEEAVRLNPNFAEAQFNLAEALAKIPGRLPEAAAHFEAMLRLSPNDANAQYKLASTLSTIPGREPEAIAHYEASLRINPENAEAQNNLAVGYAQSGRLDEAIAHLELAVKLNPAYTEARENLKTLREMRH